MSSIAPLTESTSSTLRTVIELLRATLQLGGRADQFTIATPLLGSVAELDSMAVVALITALEERFGFTVEDDELSADTFATIGSLSSFVDSKLV